MSGKKVSLQQAFKEVGTRHKEVEPQPPVPEVDVDASPPQKYNPPSRRDKRHISGFYDEEVWMQLKILGLEKDLTMQEMVGEALNCYFIANDKPPLYSKEE